MTEAAGAAVGELRAIGALELVVVTGKGGVGKSTVAAGLAEALHRTGKRVLLCEAEEGGGLADALEVEQLAFEPTELRPGFHAMAMDTEASLREYLRIYLRVPVVGTIGPLAKAFDFVAAAAPGVREVLTVGKLCYEVRERRFDVVVVDAPSSGYVTGLLSAPETIRGLVQVGLIRNQTDWMVDILHDPARTGLVAVTTPEEMPVTETLELLHAMDGRNGVAPALVVANRVLAEPFNAREREVFAALADRGARRSIEDLGGAGAWAALEASAALDGVRAQRSAQLPTLARGIGELELAIVPELFAVPAGLRMTTLIADALAEELS